MLAVLLPDKIKIFDYLMDGPIGETLVNIDIEIPVASIHVK